MTDNRQILYFAPAACARVTLTALEEIGLPFETRLIAFMAGEHRKPEYLAVNPSGKVPALDTGNGIITQNGAILQYLSGKHPEANLLPFTGDPFADAQISSMLFRMSADLHPLATRFVLPGMILSEPSDAAQVRAKAEEVLKLQLAPLSQRLAKQEWLLGDQWSILDAYLAWIWFRITGADFKETALPAIADHSQRATARPSAQAALRREAWAQSELKERGLTFTPPKVD